SSFSNDAPLQEREPLSTTVLYQPVMGFREHLPDAPAEDVPDDLPEEHRKPTLRADVYVLAGREWVSTVRAAAPSNVTVEAFSDPGEFEAALSANVAVAMLSLSAPDDRLREAARRTIAASPDARIAVLADDHGAVEATSVPHDEAFVASVEESAFGDDLKRLYVRAHYAATLDQYYRVSVAIRNIELAGDDVDVGGDDHLETLRRTRDRSRMYLRQFRRYLDPESLRALKHRGDRLRELVASSKSDANPAAHGLPESCPNCGLDWTTWHGPGRRNGYQKLGANTWQCTDCGEVVADPTPSGYHVS
ncbi:MAG: hypothetical protein ABEJ88_02275, partial [Halobacterium sp.]